MANIAGYEYEALAMYEREAAEEYHQQRDELLQHLHGFLAELARREDQLRHYCPDMTRIGYQESMDGVVTQRRWVVREIQRLNTETPDIIRRLAQLRLLPETRAEYEEELMRFRREHHVRMMRVRVEEAQIIQRMQCTERAMGLSGPAGADPQDLRMIRPGAR